MARHQRHSNQIGIGCASYTLGLTDMPAVVSGRHHRCHSMQLTDPVRTVMIFIIHAGIRAKTQLVRGMIVANDHGL